MGWRCLNANIVLSQEWIMVACLRNQGVDPKDEPLNRVHHCGTTAKPFPVSQSQLFVTMTSSEVVIQQWFSNCFSPFLPLCPRLSNSEMWLDDVQSVEYSSSLSLSVCGPKKYHKILSTNLELRTSVILGIGVTDLFVMSLQQLSLLQGDNLGHLLLT